MVEPSASSSKRPRVETTTVDPLAKEIHFDPTTVVTNDDVDEVNIDTDDAEPFVPPVAPRLSLCVMI